MSLSNYFKWIISMNYTYRSNLIRFCLFLLIISCHISSSCAVPVITQHEERDLELFDSLNKSHQGILSAFDKTYTAPGKDRLMYHLKNPMTDVALIQERQEQIRLLIENPAVLEEAKTLLAQIKDAEKDLFYFIKNQEDPVARTTIDNFYFKNRLLKNLNNSSAALDARNYLKYIGLFSPVAEHLLLHFALHSIQDFFNGHHHDHDHDHVHDAHCVHDLEAPAGSSALVKGTFTALKVAHFGIHVMSIKDMVEHIAVEKAVVNQLYKKVASVRVGLHAMTALQDLMQANNYKATAFAPLDIFNQSNTLADSGVKVFAPLLNDNTFDVHSSLGYFSRLGATLYNYQLLKDNMLLLDALMARVADMDALVSIAEWYKESATKKAQVCFVDFVQSSSTPVVRLKGMWHVGLNPNDATLNDIALSADNKAYKFIITGPNKAGKSTIIKAIGLNIILAQTFGIATAEQAQLTPFHKLLSYITVTDDVSQDKSTFVAELMRAEECLHAVQLLTPDQFACLLIDDSLFKGTSFEKSQDMAHRFLTTIGTYSNSCALIATHCAALTELEKEKPTVFKNYRMKMGTDAQGNAQSMFTLEEGIANQAAVFDIVRAQRSVSPLL